MKETDLRREAIRHMFRADVEAARKALAVYLEAQPRDALAHSLSAAVTFYHHISEHMPEGPRETLALVILGKGVTSLPRSARVSRSIWGAPVVVRRPADPPNLLAMAIVEGVKRDYLALVCRKWLDSFECARRASSHARPSQG